MLSEILTEDCYMIDIETTGLSPVLNGITSVALVRFNLNAPTVKDVILDWCYFSIDYAVNVGLARTVDLDTMKFRNEHKIAEAEEQITTMYSLQDIIDRINLYLKQSNINNRNLFALHTEFDVAFLKGYYANAAEEFPFKHRKVFELTSLIAGMDADFKEIRNSVDNFHITETITSLLHLDNMQPHNALYDCMRQIAFLHCACYQSGIIA